VKTTVIDETYTANVTVTDGTEASVWGARPFTVEHAEIRLIRSRDAVGPTLHTIVTITGRSVTTYGDRGPHQSVTYVNRRIPDALAALVDEHRPAGWGDDSEVERLRAQVAAVLALADEFDADRDRWNTDRPGAARLIRAALDTAAA